MIGLSAKPLRLWFLNAEVTIRISKTEGGGRVSVLGHRASFGDFPLRRIGSQADIKKRVRRRSLYP